MHILMKNADPSQTSHNKIHKFLQKDGIDINAVKIIEIFG